jgi:hypothetical protein
MVAKIAFLYLAYLAWGCLVLLPVVKLQEIGQGFYRFFGFTCVALQTLALGLAIWMGPTFDPGCRQAAWALGASLLFTLCFTVALKVRVRWFLWGCFALAALTGLAAITYFPWAGQPAPLFQALHAASSALLLGVVTLAMMLGHWYLVTPKLSITPLKRYAGGYILLTAWMAVLIGAGYLYGKAMVDRPGTPSFLEREFIFILFRTAWGLLVPLGLSYWIWETVRMRSTQSATGILYAAMICTLMGEAMGLYLTLSTGVPF